MWKHFYFSTSFLLVSVWGNYSGITIIENEDHYSVVKVEGGKYEDFGNVDCSQQKFEQGYYDDGTACKNVNIKFMFLPNYQVKFGLYEKHKSLKKSSSCFGGLLDSKCTKHEEESANFCVLLRKTEL
jgi:hypothetical protein